MDDQTLGALLKSWREGRGLSQSDAARSCGLEPKHWSAIESGKRAQLREMTLFNLARGTGFTLETLGEAAQRSVAKTLDVGAQVLDRRGVKAALRYRGDGQFLISHSDSSDVAGLLNVHGLAQGDVVLPDLKASYERGVANLSSENRAAYDGLLASLSGGLVTLPWEEPQPRPDEGTTVESLPDGTVGVRHVPPRPSPFLGEQHYSVQPLQGHQLIRVQGLPNVPVYIFGEHFRTDLRRQRRNLSRGGQSPVAAREREGKGPAGVEPPLLPINPRVRLDDPSLVLLQATDGQIVFLTREMVIKAIEDVRAGRLPQAARPPTQDELEKTWRTGDEIVARMQAGEDFQEIIDDLKRQGRQ